jgi:hypothetical protein
MSRVRTVVMYLSVLFFLGGTLVVAGQNKEKTGDTISVPVGTIILKAPEGIKAKRADVDFPHSVHFSNKCQDCHHKWDGVSQIPSCAASNCHDLLKSPQKPEETAVDPNLAVRYYKAAYHQSCIECHKGIKIQNKAMAMSNKLPGKSLQKVGPTACIKCHPKQ